MELNTALEQLIGLLQQETGFYRSMQVVIDREKEAAVRSDINALNELGIEKEKILAELQKKERQRRELLAVVAEKQGIAVGGLTLSGISQLVDEPFAGRLRGISKNFLAVLDRLQAANRRNKQIFEHSLALFRGSFNLLNELLTPNTVYYRTGNIQSTKSTGKCVCSEI